MKRALFLIVMMTFFAVLALDIAVPALVLGVLALSNQVVLYGMPTSRLKGKAA